MRVLFDTNVVLDVLLRREPHFAASLAVWQAADAGEFEPYLASFALPTIHYVCHRHAGLQRADEAIDICLEAFDVCALYRECVMAARKMSGRDFEDNLTIACAATDFLQAIVTRNVRDFVGSPVTTFSPDGLLVALRG